jgi:hypothetical protein
MTRSGILETIDAPLLDMSYIYALSSLNLEYTPSRVTTYYPLFSRQNTNDFQQIPAQTSHFAMNINGGYRLRLTASENQDGSELTAVLVTHPGYF